MVNNNTKFKSKNIIIARENTVFSTVKTLYFYRVITYNQQRRNPTCAFGKVLWAG